MTNELNVDVEKLDTHLAKAQEAKRKTLRSLSDWITESYEAKKCLNSMTNPIVMRDDDLDKPIYRFPDSIDQILNTIKNFIGINT